MQATLPTVLLLGCCLPSPGWSQEPPARYPVAKPIEAGVSPIALARLDALVQSFVDGGDIVGAELLVIQDRRTVLHNGYGWRDREAERAMEPGGVFCVRSMTKPLIGVATAMLIEDDVIELRDPVAKHLPSFDREDLRPITVEHLLQHTSGLPMSQILGKDLGSLEGIQQVAAMAAHIELHSVPGEAFQYSDQGTDTLTALIERVAGMPAAEFLEQRVLEPLGMDSSACVLRADHPLLPRVGSLYAGGRGEWRKFWSPAEPSLFPFFLGSQGLFASLEDYAGFLELFLRRGKAGEQRLLRARSIRRLQEPGPHPLGGSSGFPGARLEYGSLLQLWLSDASTHAAPELLAFGHTGSDGTHAWAFPKQRAMVLYFTQSRGNTTGLLVEEALGQLFLGAPYNPNADAPPFEDYLGYYVDGEDNDHYRAIVRDGDELSLEIAGRAVVPLIYAGDDRWKLRPEPSSVLAFERDSEGRVTGFQVGEHVEYRFEPAAGLPSGDELAARAAAVHGLHHLKDQGALRVQATVEMPKLGITGQAEGLYAWPNRFRIRESRDGASTLLGFDGDVLRHRQDAQPVAPLEGIRLRLALHNHLLARFGDWREWHDELVVVQRIDEDSGGSVYLVRTGGTGAPARTLYLDAATGRLIREASFTYVENIGRLGATYLFEEFADVSGMLLPARTEIRLAHPFLGSALVQVNQSELDVGVPPGAFTLED